MSHLVGSDKKVVLKTAESIYLLKLNQIIRCESDNNYTTFYTTDNERIIVSKPIKEYDEMFTDFGFMRVHQRHLVNQNYIKKFDKRDGGFLIMSDKAEVPVATRKRQQLISLFEKM